MNASDGDLLRRYVRDHSEAAFEELVQRHIGLVYSAALRQVGDPHRAQDVTQIVFSDLARKATSLIRHTSLAGWLYTSTRFAAGNLRRTEQRRNVREQEAHAMQQIHRAEPEADWAQISPLLDEAMHTLAEEDREAVLLRHFEQQTYSEIGARLGLSENAARMRVDRALDRLQATLAKNGITSTALALAGILSVNAVGTIPVAVVRNIARSALSAATGGAFVALSNFFASGLVKSAAALLVATIGLTLFMTTRDKSAPISKEVAVGNVLEDQDPTAVVSNSAPMSAGFSSVGAASRGSDVARLRLTVLAADTGQPVPLVNVHYSAVSPAGSSSIARIQIGRTDRRGHFELRNDVVPAGWNIALQSDDFADTWLLLRSRSNDLPVHATVRLDRPVTIGGIVLDPQGNPAAGARVVFSTSMNRAFLQSAPKDYAEVHQLCSEENLAFHFMTGSGETSTTTDADGRWRLSRIAADLLPQCSIRATHSLHVSSGVISLMAKQSIQTDLRDGKHLLTLSRGMSASGRVVDGEGNPVPEAEVLVGLRSDADSRRGKADAEGVFDIPGCLPGYQYITVKAPGFAPACILADLDDTSEKRIVLKVGRTLSLKVVDGAMNPVPWAHAVLDAGNITIAGTMPPQIDFVGNTDQTGTIVWTNAPDIELNFYVRASLFQDRRVMIPPGETERVIVLGPQRSIKGVVTDQTTGKAIENFRISTGTLESGADGKTASPRWFSESRQFRNERGEYSISLNNAEIQNTARVVIKCEVEGYASWTSSPQHVQGQDIQMNISLTPDRPTSVEVRGSDGQLAQDASVALLPAGVRLAIDSGEPNQVNGIVLKRTGADGTFELSSDTVFTRVVAFNIEGYAEASAEGLRQNPLLRLVPWGGLDASCFIGKNPAAGREYQLEFIYGPFSSIFYEPAIRVSTDMQGRFSVRHLPPGRFQMVRKVRSSFLMFENWYPAENTVVDIRPGEITKVDLGHGSRDVAVRVIWPPGIQPDSKLKIISSLRTPASRAGANNDRREYSMTLDSDVLHAREVQPGAYQLEVLLGEVVTNSVAPVLQMKLRRVAEGKMNVTVPASVDGEVFDAGRLTIEPSRKP